MEITALCLTPADSGKIHKVLEAGSKPFIISETQLSSCSPVQSIKLDSIKVPLMTEILGVTLGFLNATSFLGHFQWHQCTHHIQWQTQLTLGGEGDTRRGPCMDVPEKHNQSFRNCLPAGHLWARWRTGEQSAACQLLPLVGWVTGQLLGTGSISSEP